MDIQTATAVSTVSIALLVAIVTWRQWVTNRARLRHELFDRRYAIYEKITNFLGEVLQSGHVPLGDDDQFLRDTKQAFFVFDCDPAVRVIVKEIYGKAADLHALDAEFEGTSGAERTQSIRKQREIKNWFQDKLSETENYFERYLRLGH